MSSVSTSASGSRTLSLTMNDATKTVATMPTKEDDNVHAQFGAFGEIRFILPLDARLEVIGKEGSADKRLRLVVPSGSVTVYGKANEKMWPHVFVNVGKHIEDYFDEANFQVDQVVNERLGDLIAPAE